MKLVPSKEMKIDLLPEQEDYLCTKETIKEIFAKDEENICLAFDVYMEDRLVGFAMFCEQTEGIFPLSCKGFFHHIQLGQRTREEAL